MTDISVIIPCYNSEALVAKRVAEFESVLGCTKYSWEILLCDDASKDGTAAICKKLVEQSPDKRRFISSPVNRGRGANVAMGIRQSQGSIVGFADADASTGAIYLIPLIQALHAGFDVAEAYRSYKIKLFELPFIFHRLSMHVGYRQLVSLILKIKGHDTETGFKFFNRPAAEKLLEITTAPGWFWDTEVIANAHKLKMPVADIPSLFVRTSKMGTTVRLVRDSFAQFAMLVRYARRNRQVLTGPCCSKAGQ